MATLAGAFGGLALTLAAVGLYGLLAYSVANRTNEIGIRLALGARRPQVLRLVVMDALCMLALGAVSTSIAYWLWGRLLRDYPAAQVVPFALLVPFVGAAASTLVFGERFGPLRLSGMVIVICGIAVMLLSKRPQALPKIA